MHLTDAISGFTERVWRNGLSEIVQQLIDSDSFRDQLNDSGSERAMLFDLGSEAEDGCPNADFEAGEFPGFCSETDSPEEPIPFAGYLLVESSRFCLLLWEEDDGALAEISTLSKAIPFLLVGKSPPAVIASFGIKNLPVPEIGTRRLSVVDTSEVLEEDDSAKIAEALVEITDAWCLQRAGI